MTYSPDFAKYAVKGQILRERECYSGHKMLSLGIRSQSGYRMKLQNIKI
jgi:hypothetical protein